jgi:hypothetical protein
VEQPRARGIERPAVRRGAAWIGPWHGVVDRGIGHGAAAPRDVPVLLVPPSGRHGSLHRLVVAVASYRLLLLELPR